MQSRPMWQPRRGIGQSPQTRKEGLLVLPVTEERIMFLHLWEGSQIFVHKSKTKEQLGKTFSGLCGPVHLWREF